MINTNKGSVTFEGTPLEIMSEVSLIIHYLYEDILVKQGGISEDEAREMIQKAVDLGFVPVEELRKQDEAVNDALGDILEKAIGLLEKLVKGR